MENSMKLLRWIAVAFSMYSRIPMPVFEWKEDDMSGGMMFLPLIGAVIGALSVGVYYLSVTLNLPQIVTILLLALLPILITGGFHIDGYMDMTDALRSYQPTEKKLEILKDPHIGAFAVIGVIGMGLTYCIGLGFLTEAWDIKAAVCYGLIFVIARAVTGISSVMLKKAKKNGMLYEETKSKNRTGIVILLIQLLIAGGALLILKLVAGVAMIVALIVVLVYYERTTYKQFGGVTGDTAGYLITVTEMVLVVVLGAATWYGI